MSFKILSDFDGVWTDPVHEAASVAALMVAETARVSGVERVQVEADFEAFRQLAMASPAEHGWAPHAFTGGRISAFVDEDPFCAGNALACVLGEVAAGAHVGVDAALEQRARGYVDGIRRDAFGRGFEDTLDFAEQAFLDATAAWQRDQPSALVPGAAEIAGALLESGCELVLVSNSGRDKLMGWFTEAGIACHDADDESPGPHSTAVRGSAGKFVLGPGDESLEVAGRRIFLDRPKYRAVLQREAPDLVIGDVFSLDLALPAAMRAAGERGAPRDLVLRRHDYSPAWSSEDRAGGRIDYVIDKLDELPALAERLALESH